MDNLLPKWLSADDAFASRLAASNRKWLVTGAAGFIGSHLVEALLRAGQTVRALDNFATGYQRNLDEVTELVGPKAAANLEFIEADIREFDTCRSACENIDHVLHQAALGSVPRSIADPVTSNAVNIGGFLNMLEAARQTEVKSFVYAASSSTYGDDTNLPKVEDRVGQPLSPYAVTKLVDEIYADVYARVYDFKATGLRYFNVFGARQDPDGAYAAVIPKWAAAMIAGDPVTINGDGETSRDFCYIANAVQANLRAALAEGDAQGQVYNVAVGDRTSLNQLFENIQNCLEQHQHLYNRKPVHADFRAGDVRHSQADISKAQTKLNYAPTHNLIDGLSEAMPWYMDFFRSPSNASCS